MNLSIPILAALAARRSPAALVADDPPRSAPLAAADPPRGGRLRRAARPRPSSGTKRSARTFARPPRRARAHPARGGPDGPRGAGGGGRASRTARAFLPHGRARPRRAAAEASRRVEAPQPYQLARTAAPPRAGSGRPEERAVRPPSAHRARKADRAHLLGAGIPLVRAHARRDVRVPAQGDATDRGLRRLRTRDDQRDEEIEEWASRCSTCRPTFRSSSTTGSW